MLPRSSKSYLGFACTACRAPIRALSILADLPTPVFDKPDLVALICPSCGREGAYNLQTITRFEEYQIH